MAVVGSTIVIASEHARPESHPSVSSPPLHCRMCASFVLQTRRKVASQLAQERLRNSPFLPIPVSLPVVAISSLSDSLADNHDADYLRPQI